MDTKRGLELLRIRQARDAMRRVSAAILLGIATGAGDRQVVVAFARGHFSPDYRLAALFDNDGSEDFETRKERFRLADCDEYTALLAKLETTNEDFRAGFGDIEELFPRTQH